jgi:hypothetical protein
MTQKELHLIFKGILVCGMLATQPVWGQKVVKGYPIASRLNSYKQIKLTTDTSVLSEAEKKCIVHLINAAKQADEIFWKQTYMAKADALKGVKNDTLKRFMEINYGPWDRLNNDIPFMVGVGEKPKGANFYPAGFDANQVEEGLKFRVLSPYTIVKNSPKPGGKTPPPAPKPGELPLEVLPLKDGNMISVQGFGEAYRIEVGKIMEEMELAAKSIESEDPAFANYLRVRAGAIGSSDYIMSDIEWLNLNSHLDLIIGPIENYEDKLLGVKTSFEAYVLVRDKEWGKKLDRYVALLPELQASLPVSNDYKPSLADEKAVHEEGSPVEMINEPGFPPMPKPEKALSQLAVFDAVYYAGDCNSGSKTIAVNLPNDETIQKYFGTRRSQLKNTMRAKFDNIVTPIAKKLVVVEQQSNITFDAFFNNVMFHEVAHGLGVKNVVNSPEGKIVTVREALGATYSAIEECKADVLGLYMVTKLYEKGELTGSLDDYYVTFVASVFRSVRFGASSAHGKANMITFNTLMKNGCVTKTSKGYKVDVPKMKQAISDLAAELLIWQGNGNKAVVQSALDTRGVISVDLQKDLDVLSKANIPVDITFEQGTEVLGLQRFDVKK